MYFRLPCLPRLLACLRAGRRGVQPVK